MNTEYTRLPASSFSLTGVSHVWLAKDHILSSASTHFREDYRRFYLKDIQAIIVRETKTMMTINIVAAIGAVFFALITWLIVSAGESEIGFIFGGIPALFFCVALIINLAAGPTCVCYVQTAVQTRDLPSVKRLRTAERLKALLRPLITEAQGPLAAETLNAPSEVSHPSPTPPWDAVPLARPIKDAPSSSPPKKDIPWD